MTEEQIAEIIENLEMMHKSNIVASVFIGISLLALIVFIIYDSYRVKQIKKWREEYKATLNEEQLKTLENYKKIRR